MRFLSRVKSSTNKGSRKGGSSSAPPSQNGEKKIDGGSSGTNNSRQVAPETTHLGNTSLDYGSSIDQTFFEACPWLDSDCDDEFYSVNGDLTPARSIITTQSSSKTIPPAPGSPELPTLGAILKADESLKPPPNPTQRKLADLLRESQDGDSDDVEGPPYGLSRTDSFRAGQEEAGRCCMPQLARAVSCSGRGRRNK